MNSACRAWCPVLLLLTAQLIAADPVPDFNRDIRPILFDNCVYCHGPDAQHRQAELRLDTPEGAAAVLNLQDPAKSQLLERIHATDPDVKMPPPESNKTLTPSQIQLLERWIAAGAPWGKHWSFEPILAPAVPNVQPTGSGVLIRNEIDAFVQLQLSRSGLSPSVEAERHTLLRRLSLDLTGLPPSPEELQVFLNDTSPTAYEKQVERLLNSPAYGERMAWDWLDAARYADSNGYQGDRERTMWPWRDWVVKAFNENLPYDQFTIWQLAGDQLPNATDEQRLATGFCRNHMINGEGGRIPEENRVDYVMDMTETMGTVWLGLTLNCCRCHDHKFDPLTNADYYSLFAFFNQTPVNGGGGDPQTPPVLEVSTSEQQTQLAALDQQLAEHRQRRQARVTALAAEQSAWEAAELARRQASDSWKLLKVTSATAQHQTLTLEESGVVFASGTNPANDTYTLLAQIPDSKLQVLRLEALKHASHTHGGLARSDSGNFVLTELELAVLKADGTVTPLKIAGAQATFEQGNLKVITAFDGNPTTGWAVHEGKPVDKEHAANFTLAEPVVLAPGDQLQLTLRHDSPHVSHNLGRFRLLASAIPVTEMNRPGGDLLATLQTPVAIRSGEQRRLVEETFLASDTPYQEITQQIAALDKQRSDLRNAFPKVMVMADQPVLRPTFMLERGLYTNPGKEVSARTPSSLPPLPAEASANRLALAQWLVSPDQPLTARVTVNRFWQQVFGTGLVKTTEDFGVQGETPLHLDLLNWLAADFQSHGWDVKRLMRQLVTSHAYRQSSKVSPEMLEKDVANRLLARAPRHRWPFWMIRDQALATSGLLVNRSGGPAVNTYQPAGVWEETTFGGKSYIQDHGEALYRRSLYTFWRRIVAPTMFFDLASRQTCSVKVARTNTPLQALMTLNDVTYIEASRHLAEQLLTPEQSTDASRIQQLFQHVLLRAASPQEITILQSGLARTRQEFGDDPNAALALLKQGESPRRSEINEIELASWTSLVLAVLNLDETVSRE